MQYVGGFLRSFFALSALMLVGCGKPSGSIPQANGIAVSVTNGFPGVVMVSLPNGEGFCTGVIVSQYAVLTATHCLKTAGTYTVYGPEGRVYSNNPKTLGSGTVDDANDIGMLIFSQPIVHDASSIYSVGNHIEQNDKVTLVGYGCDNPQTAANGGIKRYGSNNLYEKDSDFLVLMTPVSAVNAGIIGDSNVAGTCFGDSGGPMFLGDASGSGYQLQVVGLTHAGGLDGSSQNYVSEFTNIADNGTNRGFIQSLNNSHHLGIQGI